MMNNVIGAKFRRPLNSKEHLINFKVMAEESLLELGETPEECVGVMDI